jgi:hypothetical protein
VRRERERQGGSRRACARRAASTPSRPSLWAEYLEISLDVTEELVPSRVRRPLNLIEKPEERIRELLSFVGVDPGDDDPRAGRGGGARAAHAARRDPPSSRRCAAARPSIR